MKAGLKLALIVVFGLGCLLAFSLLLVSRLPAVASFERTPIQVLTVCPAGPPACDTGVIQEAVEAAQPGATIRVARGIYSQINHQGGLSQILYLAKTVTIRGGYDLAFSEPPDPRANPTVLDAGGNGRAAFVYAASPVLEGLTLTNGDATGLGGAPGRRDAGGGMYVWAGAPVIRDCLVTANTAAQDGGGVYLRSSSRAQVIRTEFSNNHAGYGGGLYVWESDLLVTESEFHGNSASGAGAGVWLGSYSEGSFYGNTFTGNDSRLDTNEGAGGMLAERCLLDLDGNVFQHNTARHGGGGLNLVNCRATLSNAVFSDNTVLGTGAGLQLLGTDASLYFNTFAHNQGGEISGLRVGTGLDQNASTARLVNTIFAGEAVGIYVEADTSATLEGTLYGDGAWANGADWAGPGRLTHGALTLWGDPAFKDPDNLNYHLQVGSPALDQGRDVNIFNDFHGESRPCGAGFDIGADELNLAFTLSP